MAPSAGPVPSAEPAPSVAPARTSEQARCSYYYADPMPTRELPAKSAVLPTSAASFHFSLCDSLLPPKPELVVLLRSSKEHFLFDQTIEDLL
jgi:hypothetical protein